MNGAVEIILMFLILTDLVLLGSSRLRNAIRIAAAQGLALGLLPLLAHSHVAWPAVLLGVGSAGLKGFVFPALLNRALRETNARREIEPFVGYILSLLLGVGGLAVSFWVGAQLPLPWEVSSSLLVPSGLFTLWTGLFLIMARKKAITQVLGYVVMENGIFALGMVLVEAMPLLVELGVLLDVFVAVFVMGIIVFNINREFDHIDSDQLAALKEDAP
ncbi:MAG: NADH-quinone oxidoreductase subunit K [Kiritimatiellia bacterium]